MGRPKLILISLILLINMMLEEIITLKVHIINTKIN